MLANWMHREGRVWIGILSATVALSGTPAFADDGSGIAGFFSHLFSGFSHADGSTSSEPSQSDQQQTQSVQQQPQAFAVLPTAEASPTPVASADSTSAQPSPSLLTTQDSSITTPGLAPKGAKRLTIQVSKEGKVEFSNVIPWPEGEPFPMVFLRNGPGKYRIDYWMSAQENQSSPSKWDWLAYTEIENMDSREDIAFLLPSFEIQSNAPEIVALAKEITASQNDDLAKSHAIHDWVASHIDYDTPEMLVRARGIRGPAPQDALSVLHSRRAVCEGYSKLVAALHRAIGIKSRVVIGKFMYASKQAYEILSSRGRSLNLDNVADLHGWDEILINGQWIPMDTTEDAGASNNGSEWVRQSPVGQDFFNPDLGYFNFTHTKQDLME